MPKPSLLQGRAPAATPSAEVARQAQARLRDQTYHALRNVSCQYRDGVLTLNGRLPSYYLKQIAQEAVARVAAVQRVENHIEVRSPR